MLFKPQEGLDNLPVLLLASILIRTNRFYLQTKSQFSMHSQNVRWKYSETYPVTRRGLGAHTPLFSLRSVVDTGGSQHHTTHRVVVVLGDTCAAFIVHRSSTQPSSSADPAAGPGSQLRWLGQICLEARSQSIVWTLLELQQLGPRPPPWWALLKGPTTRGWRDNAVSWSNWHEQLWESHPLSSARI